MNLIFTGPNKPPFCKPYSSLPFEVGISFNGKLHAFGKRVTLDLEIRSSLGKCASPQSRLCHVFATSIFMLFVPFFTYFEIDNILGFIQETPKSFPLIYTWAISRTSPKSNVVFTLFKGIVFGIVIFL